MLRLKLFDFGLFFRGLKIFELMTLPTQNLETLTIFLEPNLLVFNSTQIRY